MRERYLSDKRYYKVVPGHYCGVYVPEHVMKKIQKQAYKHEAEVRKILSDHQNELLEHSWTLANKMDGDNITKQVTIEYALPFDISDIMRRISLFKAAQPEYVDDLYLVPSRDVAKEIAEEKLKEALDDS